MPAVMVENTLVLPRVLRPDPAHTKDRPVKRVVQSHRAFVKRQCWEAALANKAPSAPLTRLGTRLGSSTRPTRMAWTPEGPRGRRGFSLFLVCNEAPRDPEWPARRFRRP